MILEVWGYNWSTNTNSSFPTAYHPSIAVVIGSGMGSSWEPGQRETSMTGSGTSRREALLFTVAAKWPPCHHVGTESWRLKLFLEKAEQKINSPSPVDNVLCLDPAVRKGIPKPIFQLYEPINPLIVA